MSKEQDIHNKQYVVDLRPNKSIKRGSIKQQQIKQPKMKEKKIGVFGDIQIILNHPQFKPLRSVFAMWVLATLVIGGYWAYALYDAKVSSAAVSVDDTQVEFDTGSYSYTQWDGTNSWVEGVYTTPNPIWELPNNATTTSWQNMSGNVGLWHMNELSGAISDTSGQGNNGTNNGATYSQPGKLKTSMSFDGTNDYVDLGNDTSLQLTNNFAISIWVKPTDLTGDSEYILGKLKSSGIGNDYSLIWEYAANQIEFYAVGYTGTNPRTGSGMTLLNGWNHVVYSYDGTKWEGYVNGVNVFSETRSFTLDTGTGNLLFSTYNGSSNFFNGDLDEVAIFNRALSASEIENIYEKQSPTYLGTYTSDIKDVSGDSTWNSIAWAPERPVGKELPDNSAIETAYTSGNANMTGNVGLWHMNETSGAIVDSSGQGNNGTYNGALYSQSGKLNTAIGFDGSNDHIALGTDFFANDQATGTFALWFKPSKKSTLFRLIDMETITYIEYNTTSAQLQASLYQEESPGGYKTVNSNTDIVLDQWQHVAITHDGTNLKIFIDGVEKDSVAAKTANYNRFSVTSAIGAGYNGSFRPFKGEIDEVAIYNRALSATEIADMYKRGALKLKYQVRSCDDAACSGESFVGPDGTSNDYYEWGTTNSTSAPSFTLTNVPDNRYFQYKAFFESDSSTYSPELKSVTVDYTLSNAPPDTPINSAPTDGATVQLRNTALIASAYNDTDSDSQTDTMWQVDDNSDFSSPEWVRTAGSAETSTTINTTNGTFSNSLSGATELAANTVYYYRVRYNDGVAWSTWSTGTSYTTEGSVTVTAPTTDTKWAVGETQSISWSYVGSPATTVTIKADSGDGSGFDYTVATGVSIGSGGTGSYSWVNIPSSEQGANTKIRVTSDQQSIQDDSDTYKVTGGIVVTAPNGSEVWIAQTPNKTISWTTAGSVSSVDLLYSTDGGSTYPYTITSSLANSGSYTSWTLPDLASNTTVKVKVVDSSDSDAYGESDANFTIRDATVTVNIQNSSNSDHLSDVAFNPGDGTGAANQSSPFTYAWPYGSFDIIMDKVGYNTKTVTQSITGDTTLDLTMTAQSVLNKTTAAVGFETDTDTLKISAWLELNGSVITTPTSAEVWLEDNSGTERYNSTSSSPSSSGTFTFSQSPSGLPDEEVYHIKVKIINDGTAYISTTPVGLLMRDKNFNNAAVYVDTSSAYTGTAYPKGNQEHPINNITDALTIAAANSLTQIYIKGAVIVPGGLSLANYALSGHSANSGSIVLGGGSTVGTSLDNLTVSGTVNGDIVIRDSFVNGLTDFSGVIYNSALTGSTITLAGSTGNTVNILDSRSSVAGTGTPTIDFGGSGHNLSVRGYSGGLTLTNKTGASDSVSMDFVSGHAKLESSCTAGDVVIRGIVKITDNSAGCNVISYGAITNDTVADAVLDEQLAEHTTAGSFGANQINIITEVNANETKIDIVDTVVDTIANTTADTNTKVTDIQTTVNNISTLLTSVDAKIGTLQTSVAALRSSQQSLYAVELAGPDSVQVGNTYRVKLTIEDYETTPVAADSTPSIMIYDASRAEAVSSTTMTSIDTGVYEFVYALPAGSTSGLYETVVTATIGGEDITRIDYWQATGAPSQVIINSISDLTVDSIAADITISNEGNASYEYQYEWCVVTSQENQCGGDDDVYYGSAAKLVTPGVDFNKVLTATVPETGDYWFKMVNYFGTESSSASRSFTAVTESESSSGGGSSGNGPIVGSSVSTLNQLQLTSDQLIKALEGATTIDINVVGLTSLLRVSEQNTETLKDVQNKLSELQAVSDTINAVVTNNSTEPIVQAFMQFNSVELHFLITNPSKERQMLKFRAALPSEATPEDIMNADGLSVEYDPNVGSYFVSAEIQLLGGESIVKKVEMRDIWIFEPDDITALREQAKSYEQALEKTQYGAQATLLLGEIERLLTTVGQSQAASYDTPQNHIVVYRTNVGRMEQVDTAMLKLKDIVSQAGASRGLVGSIGGIQTFSTWGIVLALVFGFGLLAAIIFAMWRQQTMLISALGRHGRRVPGLKYPDVQQQDVPTERSTDDVMKDQDFTLHEHYDPETLTERFVHIIRVLSGSVLGVLILVSFPGFVIGILMFTVPAFMAKQDNALEYVKPSSVNLEQAMEDNQAHKEEVTLDDFNTFTESSAQTTQKPSDLFVVIKETPTGWLNVRNGASRDGEVISKVYPGEEYKYIKEKNGWYLILLSDEIEGWVFGDYVISMPGNINSDSKTVDEQNVETIPSEPTPLVSVRILNTPTGTLNVRGKPNASEKLLGKVYPGEKYTFDTEKNGWYFIIIPNGIDGWISGEYVELIE